VLTDLAEFNHLVTRLRFVPSAAGDAALSEDERRRGAEFASALSVRVLSRTWQMLLKGIPEVQASNRPVSAAEMVLIRVAHAADLPTLDEALKSLGDTPQASGTLNGGGRPALSAAASAPSVGGVVAQSRMPVGSGGGQTMRLVEAAEPPAPFVAPAAPAVEAPPAVPVKSLADIAALADANRDMLFKTQFKNCIRLVRIEPGRVDVSLTADAPRSLVTDLSARLEKWTGRRWMVSVSREEGGQTLAEMESAKRDSAMLDARSDPAVAAILSRFPGSKIIDVRIPNAPDAESGAADLPPEAAVDDDETDL
jgi:DNA polymerase-3 subunit gamma/tau